MSNVELWVEMDFLLPLGEFTHMTFDSYTLSLHTNIYSCYCSGCCPPSLIIRRGHANAFYTMKHQYFVLDVIHAFSTYQIPRIHGSMCRVRTDTVQKGG